MAETSKALKRRQREGFFRYYCQGHGIDIGCGGDPILPTVRQWDLQDGDATLMAGVPDESYDYVYSSHLLQHLNDPCMAIRNWWRIAKKGGFLILYVPLRVSAADPTITLWLVGHHEPPRTWGLIPFLADTIRGYDFAYVTVCDLGAELSIEAVIRKQLVVK